MKNKKMIRGFKCVQCGRCCKKVYGIDFVKDDISKIKAWGIILGCISDEEVIDILDEFETKCPALHWLEKNKYICSFHEYDIKPEMCKNFPIQKEHALKFCDCKGINNSYKINKTKEKKCINLVEKN